MFQSNIDTFQESLEKVLQQYQASLPDPSEPITAYMLDMERPTDESTGTVPVDWIDTAFTATLILHHKDAKLDYDPDAYVLELLVTFFRMAMHNLSWMTDAEAWRLGTLLAYRMPLKSTEDRLLIHDLARSITFYPTEHAKVRWYALVAPMLAYAVNPDIVLHRYVARILLSHIQAFGIQENRHEHAHDLMHDALHYQRNLGRLIQRVQQDNVIRPVPEEYLRDIMAEYSLVHIGGLLQRSSVSRDFGAIASEVVTQKFQAYNLIEQIYVQEHTEKR